MPNITTHSAQTDKIRFEWDISSEQGRVVEVRVYTVDLPRVITQPCVAVGASPPAPDCAPTAVTITPVASTNAPPIACSEFLHLTPPPDVWAPPRPPLAPQTPINGFEIPTRAPQPLSSEARTGTANADDFFLQLLNDADRRGLNVSSSKHSPNYAPKLLAKGQPVRAHTLEAAMRRLLRAGRIVDAKYGRASRPFRRLVDASTLSAEDMTFVTPATPE